MSTINGLPAHALLVHFIVVLAPLTAVLAMVSAVWVAARQRLVWLVFALAVVTSILTPLTTQAGEWLENRSGRSPLLRAHTEPGDTMIYFSVALVAAAVLLAFVHIRESRGRSMNTVVPPTEPRSVGSVSRRRPRRPSLRSQHPARQRHSCCAPWCYSMDAGRVR
jgi:ABC-type branched-subunit amino acid transport system permease subunit